MTGEKADRSLRNGSGAQTPEVSQTPLLASAYPSRMLSFMPIPGHLKNVGELRALLGRGFESRDLMAPRALPYPNIGRRHE